MKFLALLSLAVASRVVAEEEFVVCGQEETSVFFDFRQAVIMNSDLYSGLPEDFSYTVEGVTDTAERMHKASNATHCTCPDFVSTKNWQVHPMCQEPDGYLCDKPDSFKDKHGVWYKNVGWEEANGVVTGIDMLITLTGEGAPYMTFKEELNGHDGTDFLGAAEFKNCEEGESKDGTNFFGNINVRSPAIVTDSYLDSLPEFKFQFVNNVTGAPMILEKFKFSFFESDERDTGLAEIIAPKIQESLKQRIVSEETDLVDLADEPGMEGYLGFLSEQITDRCNNVVVFGSLTEKQARLTFELLYEKTDHLIVRMGLALVKPEVWNGLTLQRKQKQRYSHGGNMFFGGFGKQTFTQDIMCPVIIRDDTPSPTVSPTLCPEGEEVLVKSIGKTTPEGPIVDIISIGDNKATVKFLNPFPHSVGKFFFQYVDEHGNVVCEEIEAPNDPFSGDELELHCGESAHATILNLYYVDELIEGDHNIPQCCTHGEEELTGHFYAIEVMCQCPDESTEIGRKLAASSLRGN